MKSVWKWVIGIAAGLLLLLVVTGWYLVRHWKPLLDSRLKETVLTASDSLYRVEYGDMSLNLLKGSVSLKNFRLISDSSVYERLKIQHKAPDNRYDISVSSIRIKQVNILKALTSKQLDIREILVEEPQVMLKNEYQFYNDTLETAKKDASAIGILGPLQSIAVGNVRLNDAHITFKKHQDTTAISHVFNHVNLHVKDILIDTAAANDPERFYFTRSIDLAMGPYKLELPESLYDVGFDSLHIRTAEHKLEIRGLHYAPRVSRQEFYRHWKIAKDMTKLHFDKINLEGLNLRRFMRSQRIHARTLRIDSGSVDVSNDLRYPRRPVNKIGKSPHQQLMKLGHPIHIDTVFVKGVHISYAEISGKYHKEGKITFNRARGWLANVSNDSIPLRQNPYMEADLEAYLMNTGKLNVKFGFDMLDKKGAYTYKGSLGPMNGKSLNRILTPLLSAEVSSANIKGVRFDMHGNDHRNWGSFFFDYDDMWVNVLKTEEDGSTSKKGLISLLANEFLLNSSNPDSKGVYHKGNIRYNRPADFSFFKTLWKSLLEGIKQTAGISKEREQHLMNTAEKTKTIKEKTGGVLHNLFRKRDTTKGDSTKREQE